MLNIWFSGNISDSLFNTTRLYGIQELWLNASRISNENASFTLKITPSMNYTGTFVSALSDPDVRSSLLSYYGIIINDTVLLIDNQTLTIQGNGTFLGSFEEFFLHVHDGVISGYLQQPFQAPIVNNTGHIDLSMLYPFGKNLIYTIKLILPFGSSEIQVLSGGNYTIENTTVTWNSPIDHVNVTFTPPIHDISIVNITFSKQNPAVNETIYIHVTIENQGYFTETFDLSVYYTRMSDPLVGTQTVTLVAGGNTTLSFEWTANMTGRYQILANTTEIPYDIDPIDNMRTTILYIGYSESNPGSHNGESLNGYHVTFFIFALFGSVIFLSLRKNREISIFDIPATILKQNLRNDLPHNTMNMWQDQTRRQPM